MLEKTACDAVMVGTAAIGNPGIFAEILGEKPLPRKQAFFRYLELYQRFEIGYFGRLKTQAVKFFEGDKPLVNELQKAKSVEEIVSLAK